MRRVLFAPSVSGLLAVVILPGPGISSAYAQGGSRSASGVFYSYYYFAPAGASPTYYFYPAWANVGPPPRAYYYPTRANAPPSAVGSFSYSSPAQASTRPLLVSNNSPSQANVGTSPVASGATAARVNTDPSQGTIFYNSAYSVPAINPARAPSNPPAGYSAPPAGYSAPIPLRFPTSTVRPNRNRPYPNPALDDHGYKS